MEEQLFAALGEAAWFVLESILIGVLTVVGVLSEQIGVTGVTSGDVVGLWFVYMGAIALYAGLYMIGYGRLLPRVRRQLASR
jgi:hypothetical protein